MGHKASARRADPTRFGLCYGEIRSPKGEKK